LTGRRIGFTEALRGAAFTTFDGRLVGVFARTFDAALAIGRFAAGFFALAAFDAFWARALPAGERLVAGLRRADFKTRFRPLADLAEERNDERDDSLFSGLLI